MKTGKSIAVSCLALSLSGCAVLGLKSLPWPTSVDLHDKQAMAFLRGSPAVNAELGDGLSPKEMMGDNRLVGLTASGGGARAAAFTLGVLTELQDIELADGTSALDAIDFLSSNSGGSWGVAAYLADRARHKGSQYSLERAFVGNDGDLLDRFEKLGSGRKPCWSEALRSDVIETATFGEIYAPGKSDPLPRAFINAALLPSQSPFVFTDGFVGYYRVDNFGACANDWVHPSGGSPLRSLADLPLSYAAAASGTVPSFYYAYANTRLCPTDEGKDAPAFCHANQKGGPRRFLRIADGGIYDNIGYKTAYEVLVSQRAHAPSARRSLIIVNSNPGTDLKTVTKTDRSSSYFRTLATNGLFGVQDSTFERLYKPMFKTVGVEEPVLLDFYSTAGFTSDHKNLVEDLPDLAFAAAHSVPCYVGSSIDKEDGASHGLQPPPASVSLAALEGRKGDCLSENFYRVGNRGKTTFKFDRSMFLQLWQLGRLSVRMNCAKIIRSIDGPSATLGCPSVRRPS